MKKVVSFSLWGDNPMYTHGAVLNARLVNTIYPGWISRFYVGSCVPSNIVTELKYADNTEVVEMGVEGNFLSSFWRFSAASDPHVSVMLSRDTDSRVSERESLAVNEWLNSDKDFHIMRDHPYHEMPIMGGMWGARNGVVADIEDMMNELHGTDSYGVDQSFLAEHIYPRVKGSALVHDDYYGIYHRRCVDDTVKRFPEERKVLDFVGQQFDEYSKPLHEEYLNIL